MVINYANSGGRRKLHYLYPNQSELIEELDVNSNEVLGKIQFYSLAYYSEEMETSKRVRRRPVGI
jgi:hypothetical protein